VSAWGWKEAEPEFERGKVVGVLEVEVTGEKFGSDGMLDVPGRVVEDADECEAVMYGMRV
jgi:hypothetical protein